MYCFTLSKRIFPYGVPKINIYQNTNIIISVVPPGGFYTVERKPNDLRIDKNLNYGFAVRFVFKSIILLLIIHNLVGKFLKIQKQMMLLAIKA